MSILKGEDIEVGDEEAGKDCGSDDSDMSRGSQDTRIYQNRIYGLKGAAMKMAAQNKRTLSPTPARPTAETPSWNKPALQLGRLRPSLGQTLGRRRKPSEPRAAPTLRAAGGRGEPGTQ